MRGGVKKVELGSDSEDGLSSIAVRETADCTNGEHKVAKMSL